MACNFQKNLPKVPKMMPKRYIKFVLLNKTLYQKFVTVEHVFIKFDSQLGHFELISFKDRSKLLKNEKYIHMIDCIVLLGN